MNKPEATGGSSPRVVAVPEPHYRLGVFQKEGKARYFESEVALVAVK